MLCAPTPRAGGGGGHGAVGGGGCTAANPSSVPGRATGSFLYPHDAGGVGSGNNTGGGVIHCHLRGAFTLNGRIAVDGTSASAAASGSSAPLGGGAGGSILIRAPNGVISGTGSLSAVGGDGANGGGGGSGGRVFLEKLDFVGVKVPVFAGGAVGGSVVANCETGGSGTWWDVSVGSAPQLKCTGVNRKSIAWTPLNATRTPLPAGVALVLTWCNFDAAQYPALSAVGSLTLVSASYGSSNAAVGLSISGTTGGTHDMMGGGRQGDEM